MIRLMLPWVPPSLNKYLRMHWAEKARLRGRIGREIAATMIDFGYEIPKGKVIVRIALFHPRLFDDDNATGACKPLLDGMRDAGLIRNDSPTWMRLEVSQKRDNKNPRTEIEIEEA